MIREITITPVLNGFVCKVGCQTVVFTSVDELALNIEKYYNNPEEMEKQFLAKAVNQMNTGPCSVAEPPRERITAGEEICGNSICSSTRETRR